MRCSFEINTFLELSSGIAAWASACLGMFSKKKKIHYLTGTSAFTELCDHVILIHLKTDVLRSCGRQVDSIY